MLVSVCFGNPNDFNLAEELKETGLSPKIKCKDCLENNYKLAEGQCGMNCEDLYLLGTLVNKINFKLRGYDNEIYSPDLVEKINKETFDIINKELANKSTATKNRIKKSLIGFMKRNQAELIKLEIEKKDQKIKISDDPKKQAKFIKAMNNYLSAMDDELKELKRNEESILYAMSTSACDKKAWQLFSEYVLGDECEEGLYFKYVKTRRDLSSKLARVYRETLPEDLTQEEINKAIKDFRGFITQQNNLCDEAVENVSNGLQTTVNNAQVIYQGVLGGLMIGATGGLAAPAATVELANLGRTLAALGTLSANATGFYFLADTAKTMTKAGIEYINTDNLSAWCALAAETLAEGGNSFQDMWKEGILVGGLGMVFGGVGGAIAKSSSNVIKGLGIMGVGAMGGVFLKQGIVDPQKQKEQLEKLKDNYNDSAAGLKIKQCIDIAKTKITSDQGIDVGTFGLGLSQSTKAIKRYGTKAKPKVKKQKEISKQPSTPLKKSEFLSEEDIKRLQGVQDLINSQPKSRIILRKSEELTQKIKSQEIRPRNIFNERDIVKNAEYSEIVQLAKRLENKELMIKSLTRVTEELNKYLAKRNLPLNQKTFEKFLIKKAYQLDVRPENITRSSGTSKDAGKIFLNVDPKNGSLISPGQPPEVYARNLQMLIALEETINVSGKAQAGRLFGVIRESQDLFDELFTSVNKDFDGNISTVPKQNMANEKFMTEVFIEAFPTLVTK